MKFNQNTIVYILAIFIFSECILLRLLPACLFLMLIMDSVALLGY